MAANFTKAKLDAVLGGIVRSSAVGQCLRCDGECRAYLEVLRQYLSEEEVFCFFFAAQFVETPKVLGYVWLELLEHTLTGCGRALDEKIFCNKNLEISHCGNSQKETQEILLIIESLNPKDIFADSRSARRDQAQWAIPSALYQLACKLNAG